MEQMIAFLIVYLMICLIQSLPIENGFTIRFNPTSSREDFRTKKLGRIFTKIQQDSDKYVDENKREYFTKAFFPQESEPSKHTTPANKLSAPLKLSFEYNDTEIWNSNNMNFLNLPVISQPYADYKILVAAAPPNVNIGTGAERKKMIVYVVFPDDGSSDTVIDDIPRIYFVNENAIKKIKPKKDRDEPLIIIDSNRTVTGLKSKEIAKFLKFRNKLTNRFNYNVTR